MNKKNHWSKCVPVDWFVWTSDFNFCLMIFLWSSDSLFHQEFLLEEKNDPSLKYIEFEFLDGRVFVLLLLFSKHVKPWSSTLMRARMQLRFNCVVRCGFMLVINKKKKSDIRWEYHHLFPVIENQSSLVLKCWKEKNVIKIKCSLIF